MNASQQTATAVVFDLGGVLIDWRREFLYERLIDDPERRTWFLDTVCTLEWNADGDRGRPFTQLVAERSALFPGRGRPDRRLLAALGRDVGTCDGRHRSRCSTRSEPLGPPTFALTNWSAETLPRVRHRYEFLDSFDGMLVSGEEGIIKPDPAIYRLLCHRFGLTPERTFFVDDSPANVDAARVLGFASHRFVDAAALRSALIASGVPVSPAPRSP